MQAAQHSSYAATLRRLADDTNVSIQLAADRGDSPAALRHRDDRNALLDLASWHEAQAQDKRLAAVDAGAVPLHPEAEAYAHTPPANLPGDESIVS